jgi:Fic family protein
MINPDRTKPWNALPLLPPDRSAYLDDQVYRLLADTKGKLGELKGTARLIPNQGMLINSLTLQEAHASSEIENIFTTNDELYAAFSTPGHVEGPAKEVLRYREALWDGYNRLQQSDRLGMEDIVAIYRVVKNTNEGIRDPLRQTKILKGGSTISSGSIVYTPPRGPGVVERLLENLVDYLQHDSEDTLIKMCLAHYQFEAIHPFSDGNGRTGRILNVLYLTQQGYLDWPILFLSRYILQHKTDYYHYLGAVSQRADWKSWLRFMLKAVLQTAIDTVATIELIVEAESFAQAKIRRDRPLLDKPALLKEIFRQPYTTPKLLEQAGIGSEKTCRKYLDILAEQLQLMEKRSLSGKVYYANKELVDILGRR